ncbi:hypothetical protein DFH06DRAFT_1200840 [Mycena polygramma]|nr:hypothetical protein DFH06DRAFT_1200840 [Mycena polygramma]
MSLKVLEAIFVNSRLFDQDLQSFDEFLAPDVADSRFGTDPVQDNEQYMHHPSDDDEFGYEIPTVAAPGPIPQSYPPDDDLDANELEYADGSELRPAERAAILDCADTDSELLPADTPPGSGDFVADNAHVDEDVIQMPVWDPQNRSTDWDPPLVPGQTTRSGRKRRVYETESGLCDCGVAVDESEREDSMRSICCSKGDCETGWYHRDCLSGQRYTKAWVCPACSTSKRRKN